MSSNTVIPKEEYRFLGPTGLRVSSISLGGWLTYGDGMQVEDDKTKEILDHAFKAGINYFDTAEAYGGGKCETSMGRIIKELAWPRDQYVLSTKIFWGTPPHHVNKFGLSRKHIIEGVNASLERLQHEYVDIVFAHRPDPYTPMEEVVRAFTQVINDGKALYWGTSMWSAFEIEHAHHIADKYNLIAPVVEQPEYHLLRRDIVEEELAPIYKLYNYGTTVFSPLATGILTGKYTDPNNIPEDSRWSEKNRAGDNFLKSNFEKRFKSADAAKTFEKLQKYKAVADKLGVSQAALSLAFLLKNKNVSTLITGASRKEQIDLNLEAYKALEKLDDAVVEEIEKIFDNKPAEKPHFGRL